MARRFFARDTNVDARPHQTSAHGARAMELIETERQLLELAEQLVHRNSRVDQRSQKHVAANAGRAIQVSLFHINLGRISPARPRRIRSARSSAGVESGFSITTRAPGWGATFTSPAAGYIGAEVLTTTKTSRLARPRSGHDIRPKCRRPEKIPSARSA